MKRLTRIAIALVLATPSLTSRADAGLLCALPLWVHEWGVHVFDGGGVSLASGLVPSFFHTAVPVRPPQAPVRELPRDNGMRELPVIHFYSQSTQVVPVGVEVGFSAGAATAWYPQVDLLRSANDANSAKSQETGRLLALKRAGLLDTNHPGFAVTGPDPTRQLVWDRLELTTTPHTTPTITPAKWVNESRAFAEARWVNRAPETERFLFYEGNTREAVPLKLRRAKAYTEKTRVYTVTNQGPHPIHDLVMVHRDATGPSLVTLPALMAGASADVTLRPLKETELTERAATFIRAALVDSQMPTPPPPNSLVSNSCGTHDDPGLPVEHAKDHRLFVQEVELILDTWGARFFKSAGTTIIYREDTATLDAAMPLSIYTDTQSYAVIHRAGLALWQNVPLP